MNPIGSGGVPSSDSDDGLAAKVGKILGVLSTSVYGISFMENPVGFVAAALIDYVVGWVLRGGATISVMIGDLFDLFIGVTVDAGGEFLEPFNIGGNVIVELLADVNSIVVGIASGTGLFAPILAVAIWAAVFVLVGKLIQWTLVVIKWLT